MADPTPQQLAKALTLDEQMAGLARDFGTTGLLTAPAPDKIENEKYYQGMPNAIGYLSDMVKNSIYGASKAAVLPSHVAQGGEWTFNDVTDMALNLLGWGGFGSMGLGKAAVGGPGGKVLGANVAGGPPHRWLPPHQKEAWDQIPSVAERVKARMENELGVPVTISQSDTNYGRSWYVKPQMESTTGEGPFSVRISDHSANSRPHLLESRIDMVDSPTRTVATPEYVDAQIEKALEFAKIYRTRNPGRQPLPTDTASRMVDVRSPNEREGF